MISIIALVVSFVQSNAVCDYFISIDCATINCYLLVIEPKRERYLIIKALERNSVSSSRLDHLEDTIWVELFVW